MSQAKTLTPAELEQVLNFIASRKFPLRNRVMLLTGFWSGMRVGEIASLKINDVMNVDGSIKAEVRLTADQTKGRQPRTVFLPQKLRYELQRYLDLRQPVNPKHPVFMWNWCDARGVELITTTKDDLLLKWFSTRENAFSSIPNQIAGLL